MIIDSENELVQNKRRAFNWTNDSLVYWRIYSSLSLDELILNVCKTIISETIDTEYTVYDILLRN